MNKKKIFFGGIGIVLVIIFGLIFINIAFPYRTINVQQQEQGLIVENVISSKEIDYYLDFLNKERFTEESKKNARNFIKNEFQKYGYKVIEQSMGKFVNIVAYKNTFPENYVLVGAHYDTVPNSPGADDNASGVAAMLAMAKYNTDNDNVFVAFDGEEQALIGSKFYVDNMIKVPELVIVLETIGYYSDNINTQSMPRFYNIIYRGMHKRLKENQFRGNFSASVCTINAKFFCDNYEKYAYNISLNVYSVYIPRFSFMQELMFNLFRSDHAYFALKGIPAVMITDTANFRNKNYHKPSDIKETVNSEFIATQASTILNAITVR